MQGPAERTSFEGVLNVRTLPVGSFRTLGFELSALEVQRNGKAAPALAKSLSQPFSVEISATGELGTSRFLPEVPRTERATLDGLVRSLELVVPQNPATHWEARESDQNGDYTASYEFDAPSRIVTKTKQRYTSSRRPGLVSLTVSGSTLHVELDPDLWIHSAEFQEQMALVGHGGKTIATVDVKTSLSPLDRGPDSGLALLTKNVQAHLTSPRDDASAPAVSAWDELARIERREAFLKAGINLDTLLGNFGKVDIPRSAVSAQTTAYLQSFPDETQKLATKLAGASDASLELFAKAMVSAGTQQAEEALLGLLKGSSSPPARVRILRALAEDKNASQPVADAVLGEIDGHGSNVSDDVTATAAKVLHLIGMRPGPAQKAIWTGLRGRLAAAVDVHKQALLLQALQCDPTISVDDVAPFLRAGSVEVRVAAAALLAVSYDPRATEELAAILADGANQDLQKAVLSTFSTGPVTEPRCELAARLVTEGRSLASEARHQLVQYLAKGLRSCPQDRDRLQLLLKRETSRPILAEILDALSRDRALPAHEAPGGKGNEAVP
jgi:hypothetical protein